MILHERYSKSADVHSYGCVLFELLTHETPFADRRPLQAAAAVGLNDERPPLPAGTPAQVASVVQSCWQTAPAARPPFQQLRTILEAVAARLTSEEHAWLDEPFGHPIYRATPRSSPRAPSVCKQASV